MFIGMLRGSPIPGHGRIAKLWAKVDDECNVEKFSPSVICGVSTVSDVLLDI